MSHPQRDPWRGRSHAPCCLLLVTAFVGCHTLADGTDHVVGTVRHRGSAYSSWYASMPLYRNVHRRTDFGRGYRAGYRAVADGYGADPPVLAPRNYRSSFYSTDRGREATQAWYDGYFHGAMAATMAGEDVRNQVFVNSPGIDEFDCPVHGVIEGDPDLAPYNDPAGDETEPPVDLPHQAGRTPPRPVPDPLGPGADTEGPTIAPPFPHTPTAELPGGTVK